MNCSLCGFVFTSYGSLIQHVPTAHPEINMRNPSAKERRAIIVGIVEDRLAGFLL